jgi:hypothetical protein
MIPIYSKVGVPYSNKVVPDMMMETISHKTFVSLARAGALTGVTLAAHGRSWSVVARVKKTLYAIEAKRGGPREFAKPETAIKYLSGLGIKKYEVDASEYDPDAKPKNSRPDAAVKLRQAHEAVEHDKWFREQVEIGLKEADSHEAVWHDAADVEARAKERRKKALAQASAA